MRVVKPFTVAALLCAALPLSACSSAPAPEAHVVVRVAPSTSTDTYEVHLAQHGTGFRSRFDLRPGQARTVAVPKGWITVRVAGLCVVPTPAIGTTTVEVRTDDCRIT